jgi:hypothetical protein
MVKALNASLTIKTGSGYMPIQSNFPLYPLGDNTSEAKNEKGSVKDKENILLKNTSKRNIGKDTIRAQSRSRSPLGSTRFKF